jgi:putative thioredoxin
MTSPMIDLSLGLQPKPSSAPFIKDTDEMHFEQDVLQASMAKPVIVQFWALGSALCKQMTPVLEKLVAAAGGSVHLVKVNVSQNPGLAQALRIQAVPTVYIFFQGRPVDGFSGSKTEAELNGLVEGLKKLAGPAAPEDETAKAEHVKKLMAEADAFFQKSDFNAAMERYGAVMELAPENMEALGGIGWCLLSQGDAESVREMLTQVTPEQAQSPRLKGLGFILSLGEDAANVEALIDRLVAEVKKNREGEARARLLEIFEALGPSHPLTLPGRRKLSTVLFS